MKMIKPLRIDSKLIPIIGLCYRSRSDVDDNASDQMRGNDKNKDNYRISNEKQQVDLTSQNPTTTRLQYDTTSLKKVMSKYKFAKSFQSSTIMPILLLIMVMPFKTKYFQCHGFSSFTIRSETARNGRQKYHRFLMREQKYLYVRHRGEISNSANCAQELFLSSPLIEQEAEISLEWVEYFSPTIDGDATVEEQQTPVLFLHGLLGSKRNFATCANMLAAQLDKKRRIMGVDLRNHGDTQPWSDKMSYPCMAQDVVNFLKSQNIEKIILVGHSMGGKVAQALSLLYPEYVEGLVVLDIAPVTYSREEDPHWRAVEDILRAIHRVIEEAAATGVETTKRDIDLSLRKSIPDPALRAFVLTNYDSRNNAWKIPIAIMVNQLEQIAGFDLTAASKSTPALSSSSTYEGDVFIINGGQSRFVRHAYMDQIASYFPNHMLTTIRGSGHWVHAEAPDDLVALLKRYLDR